MERGSTASSRVCSRHLSTPRGAPVGKGRAGSFSPSRLSLLQVGFEVAGGRERGHAVRARG